MKPDRKRAAAISAVVCYMKSQEEAVAEMEPEFAEVSGPRTPAAAAPAGAWGLSGRQQQMQMRNLMQVKALQRGGGRR